MEWTQVSWVLPDIEGGLGLVVVAVLYYYMLVSPCVQVQLPGLPSGSTRALRLQFPFLSCGGHFQQSHILPAVAFTFAVSRSDSACGARVSQVAV